jgi:hypothetical protein
MKKRATELTPDDLLWVNTWEYYGDDDASAVVTPSLRSNISEDDGTVYLIATEFQLADGTILSGFSSPTDDSGLDYLQPVVFHKERQLKIWTDRDGLINIAHDLNKNRDEVFPILWRALVPVDGNTRSGSIGSKEAKL